VDFKTEIDATNTLAVYFSLRMRYAKTVKRKLALSLLICFSLSILVLAFHHHEDGVPHDNCSVCFNVTHHANVAFQVVQQVSPPTSDIPLVSLEHKISLSSLFHSPYSNRAPPA
jgi:hypothetical protein